MLGLTDKEYGILCDMEGPDDCRCGTAEEEDNYDPGENAIIDALLDRGLCRTIECPVEPRIDHFSLTEEGALALRIHKQHAPRNTSTSSRRPSGAGH